MNWTPTKERLPKEGERVLVVVTDKPDRGESFVCCGSRFDSEKVPSGFQLDDDTVNDMLKDNRRVTHWMPLPEPPTN